MAVCTPRSEASGGTSPANSLISGFWPLELRYNTFLLFKPHPAWDVCHSSPSRLIHLIVQGGRRPDVKEAPTLGGCDGESRWALGDFGAGILTSPRLSILTGEVAPSGPLQGLGTNLFPQDTNARATLSLPWD